jgi:hypothetical protein
MTGDDDDRRRVRRLWVGGRGQVRDDCVCQIDPDSELREELQLALDSVEEPERRGNGV